MLDVIISLLPVTVAGIIIFGMRSLLIVSVCVASSVLSEYVFNLILKREQTIYDLSAVVTGLLLALNLPAKAPIWQCIVGSVFAIIVVKCLFGGLGKNLVNPAMTARVFMIISFTSMADPSNYSMVDTASTATPLTNTVVENNPSMLSLFLGNHAGSIGETCILALLIGGIYLVVRKVITWHLPVAFIGSTFVLSLFLNSFNFSVAFALTLSGGLFIGAIFMATDYVTSPSTAWGKVIFGVGAALITVLIRSFGSYPEGVSFAILMMNILTPYIDTWTTRKLFGVGGESK